MYKQFNCMIDGKFINYHTYVQKETKKVFHFCDIYSGNETLSVMLDGDKSQWNNVYDNLNFGDVIAIPVTVQIRYERINFFERIVL